MNRGGRRKRYQEGTQEAKIEIASGTKNQTGLSRNEKSAWWGESSRVSGMDGFFIIKQG